jgi:hypothetical protein
MANYYYFRKYFSTDFILEPEILRQIDSKLKSFIEEEQLHLKLEYKVSKDDRQNYVISDIERLLSDPNSKRSRISHIVIQVGEEQMMNRNKTPIFIECRFSRNYGSLSQRCKVEIHDYRSGISQQCLADHLCDMFEHTQREASFNIIDIPNWLKGWLPPTFTFYIFLFWLRRWPFFESMKLGNMSVIDFPFYITAIGLVYFLCFFVWKAVELPRYLADRFRVTGIFLWGAEVHDYRRRVSFKEKLTWGIVMALVVGIIASLIATWLTSK